MKTSKQSLAARNAHVKPRGMFPVWCWDGRPTTIECASFDDREASFVVLRHENDSTAQQKMQIEAKWGANAAHTAHQPVGHLPGCTQSQWRRGKLEFSGCLCGCRVPAQVLLFENNSTFCSSHALLGPNYSLLSQSYAHLGQS